jgi:hypothetical protein
MNRCFPICLLTALFLTALAGSAKAQNLSVTPLGTQNPPVLVQNLMGTGLTFSNVSYTGTAWSSGTFTGGNGIIGFNSGIILSNGTAASVVGPSSPVSANTCNNAVSEADPQLSSIAGAGATLFDITSLSFDFVPTYSNITFQYVFASDEYNQFVGSYDDVFGFFVNGVNAALLPGSSTVVSINTVNACQNSAYYVNNNTQPTELGPCTITLPSSNLNTLMYGLTTVLTVNAAVNPGVTNTIRLAICDVGDCLVDSNVFIEAGSFSSGITPTPTNTPSPSPTPTLTPTLTPCGFPGNTCTPTDTPTPTNTPYYTDIFEISQNILRPSQSPVSIYVNTTQYPGNYELWIYNTAGEHIKTLDSRQLSGPVSQWYSWDGKNKYGDTCASGVYFFYLVEPNSRKTKRIILVR